MRLEQTPLYTKEFKTFPSKTLKKSYVYQYSAIWIFILWNKMYKHKIISQTIKDNARRILWIHGNIFSQVSYESLKIKYELINA